MKTFIIEYVPLIVGLYLLYIGVMFETKNFKSAVIFNYIPMLLSFMLIVPFLAKYLV